MPTPASVDAYIAALPEDRRDGIETLRRTIREAAPEAVEVITYQMPGFRTHDQFLVSYAAFKRHYSLFPATEGVIDGLGADIEPHLFGKGTIQFQANEPIPVDIVRRIIAIRLEENEARAAARRQRPRRTPRRPA